MFQFLATSFQGLIGFLEDQKFFSNPWNFWKKKSSERMNTRLLQVTSDSEWDSECESEKLTAVNDSSRKSFQCKLSARQASAPDYLPVSVFVQSIYAGIYAKFAQEQKWNQRKRFCWKRLLNA